MRPAVTFLVRLVIAVGLTWLAFRWTGLRVAEVWSYVAGASVAWLAFAVALVLVDRTVMAWRWVRLLRASASGVDVRLRPVLRVFFISSFAGTFLPGGGGDAVRALGASRLDVRGGDALGSVVVDRMLGLLSMLAMGLVGLGAGVMLAGPVVERRVVVVAFAVSACAALAAVLLLFDTRVLSGIVRLVSGGRSPRLERLGTKALDGIRQYGRRRDLLGWVFGASVAIQAIRALQAWCLGQAVGLALPLVWYLAFVPLITLIMQLPISISGIGTSQLAFQYFFARVGGDPALAVVVSLLYVALGWIGTLPGGLLLVGGAGRAAEKSG